LTTNPEAPYRCPRCDGAVVELLVDLHGHLLCRACMLREHLRIDRPQYSRCLDLTEDEAEGVLRPDLPADARRRRDAVRAGLVSIGAEDSADRVREEVATA